MKFLSDDFAVAEWFVSRIMDEFSQIVGRVGQEIINYVFGVICISQFCFHFHKHCTANPQVCSKIKGYGKP